MLRRTLSIALVIAGCGGRATVTLPSASASASTSADSRLPGPPERVNHGSGPNGCFTREELAARMQQAKADDESTYITALHRGGLEPIHLTVHTLVQGTQELPGPFREAHVEERELLDHRRARLVVLPPTAGCGDLSNAFEFARGGHRVWLVQRRVQTRRIDAVACGCPSCKCEPQTFSGGCGGARVAPTTILGYELPAGMEFAGKREVEYAQDWVTVSDALPPQPVCAPVQPVP